jgi:DNA-binding Lrp family transcriptional regulator
MQIHGIDETDNRIVQLLLEDGRMSYSDIGEKVGLSRTAVKTRMAALERSGIIKGYKAIIDPQAAPEMMTFVMNIETKAENFEECKQIFCDAKETVTIVQTTGNCHLVAICISPDVQTMRKFVNSIYKSVPGILSINAHSVLDVVKGSIIPEK